MFVFAAYDKETGRNIAVQVINNPAFAVLDLPSALKLVKQKARAPVVAVEIFYFDDGYRIEYLAEKEA